MNKRYINMLESKELGNKFLSDCPSEKAFWMNNGVVCRNIYELVNNIESMSEEDFLYHVNRNNSKNDFAIWIHHVLGDDVLAQRLHTIMEKDRYADIIKERVREVESL